MLGQVQSFLLENWDSLPMGRPKPRRLSTSVRGTGVGKLCCYVFADDESEPACVVKLPRSPRENDQVAAEYALVRYLRQRGGVLVRGTVPGPLFTATVAGRWLAVEPYLRGAQMDGLIVRNPARIDHYLDLAVGWLVRCQQEVGAKPRKLGDDEVERYVVAPAKRLMAGSRLTGAEEQFVQETVQRAREMAAIPLPLVFEHGDFRPANILVEGSSLQVLDWEFGSSENLPLFDVFSCLARVYARSVGLEEIDGYLEDYVAALEAVFFRGGAFAGRTVKHIEWACRELDIAPQWVSVLLPMFLVHEANKYRDFLYHRAATGYVYLMRSRESLLGASYREQLARQKNVWLLGHLAANTDRSLFSPSAYANSVPSYVRSHEGLRTG